MYCEPSSFVYVCASFAGHETVARTLGEGLAVEEVSDDVEVDDTVDPGSST
jgi:hypothetical protein